MNDALHLIGLFVVAGFMTVGMMTTAYYAVDSYQAWQRHRDQEAKNR